MMSIYKPTLTLKDLLKCPSCASVNTEYNHTNTGTGIVSRNSCLGCGFTWTDKFEMTSRHLETGDVQTLKDEVDKEVADKIGRWVTKQRQLEGINPQAKNNRITCKDLEVGDIIFPAKKPDARLCVSAVYDNTADDTRNSPQVYRVCVFRKCSRTGNVERKYQHIPKGALTYYRKLAAEEFLDEMQHPTNDAIKD